MITEYLIIRIAKVGIIVNIDFTGSKFYAAKEDTADNVIKYMARTIAQLEKSHRRPPAAEPA